MKKVMDKKLALKLEEEADVADDFDVEFDQKQSAAEEEKRRDALLINLQGRRIGKLYFDIKWIDEDAESFMAILSRIGFFPIRVEARLDIQQFDCAGLSPQFRRIPAHEPIPVYTIMVEEDGMVIKVDEVVFDKPEDPDNKIDLSLVQ